MFGSPEPLVKAATDPMPASPVPALQPGEACLIADPAEDEALWPWRLLLLVVTSAWGANFAIVKLAADSLGNSAEAVTLFTAARFLIGATLLSPALLSSSSRAVLVSGGSVGVLVTMGYAAQVAALNMGSQPGTAAFICSLNSVAVAVLVGQKTGCVSPRTWWAIALSVLGVACLEVPSVLADGGGVCLGDVVAFGQPLGFVRARSSNPLSAACPPCLPSRSSPV